MRLIRGTVVAVVLCVASVASANSVVVYPAEATNIDQERANAVAVLAGDAYGRHAGVYVITPNSGYDLSGSDSLHVNVVQLTSRIRVRCTLMAPNGAVIHQVEAYAYSFDDIEPVAERLGKALAQRTTFELTSGVNTITEKEATVPNRRYVRTLTIAKVAPVMPLASNVSFQPSIAAALYRRSASQYYFWEFGLGMMLPTWSSDEVGLGGVLLELGGGRYLGDTDTSPFVSLGVSLRILDGGYGFDGGVNLAPYAGLGLELMREAAAGIQLELRVTQNMFPNGIEDPAGRRDVRVTELSALAGLSF